MGLQSATNVYVADTGNNAVRYFGNGGMIVTLAGNGTAGYAGDGGNVSASQLNAPQSVALDLSGDLYIADAGNDVIREITATNQISAIAGKQGLAANTGDGGAATAAEFNRPSDMALDAAGDLYVAVGGQVRLINTAGSISTLAGTGATGSYSGEGGTATTAVLPAPVSNLMLDSAADVFLSDTAANRLVKVTAATPMPLNFGVQAPGTTGSPTTFALLNTGNSTLNLSGITVTTGFILVTGSGSTCTSTIALAPGQTCTVSIEFSPAVTATGSVIGTLTLTDNARNVTGATQSFALSGSTHLVATTTTSISTSPSTLVYGVAATVIATISNGASPGGSVSFTVNGNALGMMMPVSNNQATIPLPVQPAGSVKIGATYSGDTNNNSSSVTSNVIVAPAILTVTAQNVTMSQGTAVPALTYTVTGLVNGDSSSVVTGAPAETTTATSASPQGAYPITITQGTLAASNYTFTFVKGTLTVGPPPKPDYSLAVTPTQATIPAGNAYLVTLALTPIYGYRGTPQITCTSAPAGLGCLPPRP